MHDQVISVADAAERVRAVQAAGETVVMCHGCFDIVHPGHIRHLQHAAQLGDHLLVTVTGDALMSKGEGRPLIPEELRGENLAALDCVRWVAISREPTAVELLEAIRPDVYVKGREYEHNRDPRFEAEKAVVQSNGGRVVFTSGDVIFSSTALIREMEATADPAHAAIRRLAERYGADAAARLEEFRGRRILVVGETIIDTYVMCDRPTVASEHPVMTLRPIEYRSFDGGAAIVARHLAAMGAEPVLLTALPRRVEAEALRRRLEAEGVAIEVLDAGETLIEKQRFLVGTAKVMKLDLGGPMTLDAGDQDRLVDMAGRLARSCEGVIITDFGQGLFTTPTLTRLCGAVREQVSALVGDVSGQRANLLALRDADLLCPSEVEMRAALHDYEEGLSAVAWRLLRDTRARAAMVTLGEEGLIAFEHRSDSERRNPEDWARVLRAEHVPALTPHAVDPLGCGDALLAAATLTLVAGGSVSVAGLLGSLAAASAGQRLGNLAVGMADLRRSVARVLDSRLVVRAQPDIASVIASGDAESQGLGGPRVRQFVE